MSGPHPNSPQGPSLVRGQAVRRALGFSLLIGAFYGIVMGAALASVPYARGAATAGALVLAIVGALAGNSYGGMTARRLRIPSLRWTGIALGAVNGALVGAYVGAVAMAPFGTAPGALAGIVGGRALTTGRARSVNLLLGLLTGAGAGAAAVAFWRDRLAAADGALYGALAGTIAGALLFVVFLAALGLLFVPRRPSDPQ